MDGTDGIALRMLAIALDTGAFDPGADAARCCAGADPWLHPLRVLPWLSPGDWLRQLRVPEDWPPAGAAGGRLHPDLYGMQPVRDSTRGTDLVPPCSTFRP